MSNVITRLGDALRSRYEVSQEIGAGGMATVYLAHDVRHDRDVAIKVLHPDLAAALGAERFLAEIKTTAKLQHPHILPLLDSGEADGLLYYVMPFVAGESLRTRLDRQTQLPIEEAIRIAREVASAVESAHNHGVVHRDIKPENILLHEDHALVADFGIALAVTAAGGARMTQTGLSLGTPQYMAPEQAMGERAIDGRADVYALGAVTYEMLVGEAPFTGPTIQAIVARVMTETPRSMTGQRKSVPQNVNAAVLRALEKLPADRFSTAGEFSRALVASDFGPLSHVPAETTAKFGRKLPAVLLTGFPWAHAAAIVVAAIAFASGLSFRQKAGGPIHLSIDLPANMPMPPVQTEVLGISPDGMTVAFAVLLDGKSQIVLRRLDSDTLRVVPGSAGAVGSAEFSPDGRSLAFGNRENVFTVPIAGRNPSPVATTTWPQLAWIGNESIVFLKDYDTGLSRVEVDGGDSATLTIPDRKKNELGHWWPQMLPDGDHMLFTNYTTPADRSNLEVLSLKSGKREIVFRGGYYGRYVPGFLLFARGARIMAVPFDARRLKVAGSPVALPIDVEVRAANGWAGFAVSPTGTLVYREDVLRNVEAVWADASGNEEPALDSAARITAAIASPDNKVIAVVRDGDVWIYNRQRRVYSRLTRTEQVEQGLVWTPDSREIIYSRDVPQYEVFKRSADGSTPEQRIVTSPRDKTAWAVTPDGKFVLYSDEAEGGTDIFATPLDPSDKTPPRRLISAIGTQSEAQISPNGRWLSYSSTESGRPEVYLTAFPVVAGSVPQQVTSAGGGEARWDRDGRFLTFVTGGQFVRTAVDPATGQIGGSTTLSRIRPNLAWSVGGDGRFLLLRLGGGTDRRSLKVILNWTATLKGIVQPAR